MQQTEKYKLNLIESSDPFLPDGLNANTQKVEEVLKGMEDGPLAEMDERVAALEAHKFYVGTYTGTGRELCPRFVDLGFTPIAVCVSASDSSGHAHWAFSGSINSSVNVVEGGFQAGTLFMGTLNDVGVEYPFLVFT